MRHTIFSILALAAVTGSLKAQQDSAKEQIRPFQLTFITPLGTNGIEAFKITNALSMNILMGVSKGLSGFEAGGIANMELQDMKGAQFAGVTNLVLGNVNGGQFASCFNFARKDFKGVAFAGAANVSLGTLHGGQFAGGFNFNNKGGEGVQIAGHSNLILGDLKGTQIAGVLNIAKGYVEGAQISAGVNVARKVKGVQIGLINIADTVDGASIALLNFVKNGKHQLEVSADEFFYANLSYRTGTDAFYNIFTAGIAPGTVDQRWTFGYGAGTSIRIKEKIRADISATAQHVNTNGFYWGTSELFRLYCGVEYKLAHKLSVAAGPTFNLYMSDVLLQNAGIKDVGVPYSFFNHVTNDDFRLKGWVGGRIALRFL